MEVEVEVAKSSESVDSRRPDDRRSNHMTSSRRVEYLFVAVGPWHRVAWRVGYAYTDVP